MSEKIIYGQAWVSGDKVVQDITKITEKGCFDSLKVLVEDIWDDLTSETGTYKSNSKKNYFYWEYEQTPIDNDDITVKAMLPCPTPKCNLFEEPLSLENAKGDYAKYWIEKFIIARDNAEKEMVIQRKEIYLHGTDYIDPNGNLGKIEDMHINNTDNDITNLLNLL